MATFVIQGRKASLVTLAVSLVWLQCHYFLKRKGM